MVLHRRRSVARSLIAAWLLDELRQGVKEIEFLADPASGEVIIGELAAMMGGLLPKVIAELRLTHPRLSLNVSQVLTIPGVYDNLRTRTFDLIIGRLPTQPLDADLASEKLFEEPITIVAGKGSPLARRRKLSVSELLGEPWVLPQPGTQVGSLVADIFGSRGARPTAPIICSSIEMYWGLLATGRFIAAMPLSLLTFAPQRNAVVKLPIKITTKPNSVGIVTLRNRTLSPAARLFIEKTRDVTQVAQEGMSGGALSPSRKFVLPRPMVFAVLRRLSRQCRTSEDPLKSEHRNATAWSLVYS